MNIEAVDNNKSKIDLKSAETEGVSKIALNWPTVKEVRTKVYSKRKQMRVFELAFIPNRFVEKIKERLTFEPVGIVKLLPGIERAC